MPVVSYFAHNEGRRGPELLGRLQGGARVALVTDAGTPGVSDPGFRLVRLCRDAGIPVVPIPGPSALVAALSAAGVPADRFVFEGFLPPKPGRRRARLEALRALGRPVVLYESPHRVLATLEAIEAVFGDAEVVLAREVTKRFEEFRRAPRRAQGRARRSGGPGRGHARGEPARAGGAGGPGASDVLQEGAAARRRPPRTPRRGACPSWRIWASCDSGSS